MCLPEPRWSHHGGPPSGTCLFCFRLAISLTNYFQAHKIQSPHEQEAVISLAVLEACVKSCGTDFHSEVGKFRFLNEMVKLVSPKYSGTSTSDLVKQKIIELLYLWTIQIPYEKKIVEAELHIRRLSGDRQHPSSSHVFPLLLSLSTKNFMPR